MFYAETSFVLAACKDEAAEGRLKEGFVVSDLVIAEIHNLDEPWRTWSAQLLKELNPVCLRIENDLVEFAKKYVYNKVIGYGELSLGIHYILAACGGADLLVSCDARFSELKAGFDNLNRHFGRPTIDVEVAECADWPRDMLSRIRGMVGRLCESQGSVRLTSAVYESLDFFFREKELRLRRVARLAGGD